MKSIRKSLGAGLALGAAVLVGAGLWSINAQSADKPFGDAASIKYSQDLWAALSKVKLVGANAMADKPYEGQEPHGAILETMETEVTVNGHTGTAVVKRNYGPGGITVQQVSSDPAAHLKAVTVMFKREAGYDADNKNWFWVKFKPDGSLHKNPKGMELAGRVAKGMDKGCIACHSAAGGGDYMFRND